MFAFLLIISLCHTALGQSYSQSSSDAEAETPVGCGLRNMFGVSDNNIFDENFAKFGEFPWVVAILKTSDWTKDETKKHEYLCSGSLIHPSYVLTAAHCVMPQDEGEPLQKELLVRAGEWDTSSTSEPLPHQDRTVDASMIPTEEQTMYYAGGRFYDIALLKLKEPMNLTDNVQVVCLPLEDTPVPSSANCFTTGWKRNAPADGSPNLLKKVELPLVSNQLCQSRLRTRTKLGQQFELHESFLCAGGEPGVDPCKGDGGSPLVCPIPGATDLYMQFGIVSWNKGCGRNRVPAVFSSISKSYKWLDKLLYNMDVDFSPYDPIIEPTQPN